MSKLLERPFTRTAALWAVLHFVMLGLLAGLLYLLIHIPPKAANLDPLILAAQWVADVIYFPILALRWLWPGESSPWLLNVLTRLGGSVVFGLGIAWGTEIWRRLSARR